MTVESMTASNEAFITVRDRLMLGPILGRVVAMLAARASCPVDRLDDALLLTDAVAAHAPDHFDGGIVGVRVRTDGDSLRIVVGPLVPGGAEALLEAGSLPAVGNVFRRIADDVAAEDDELRILLRFGATAS